MCIALYIFYDEIPLLKKFLSRYLFVCLSILLSVCLYIYIYIYIYTRTYARIKYVSSRLLMAKESRRALYDNICQTEQANAALKLKLFVMIIRKKTDKKKRFV